MIEANRNVARYGQTPKRETLPKLFLENVEKYRDKKVAMRKKVFGIWKEYTWFECYEKVKYIALGLAALGLKWGENVSIIGDNDPEWYWADMAIQSLGGAVVGIYTDVIPSELQYLVTHSDSVMVFAKDQEQIDKMLEIKAACPLVKNVIYWDSKGMWKYDDPYLVKLGKLIKFGHEYETIHPTFFEDAVEKGSENDICLLAYTSGTTGAPKGVMIDHKYLLSATRRMQQVHPHYSDDDYLSFIPPAWIAEHLIGLAGWITAAFTVNFCEEPETVQENIVEIGPQLVLFNPRQWESYLSTIQMKMEDADLLKKAFYKIFLPIGYKVVSYKFDKRIDPPLFWKFLYRIAECLLFKPLRNQLGLTKVRMAMTGGSLLGPDVFHYFHAIGIPLKESYGLTELTPMTSHGDHVKVGTVGPPMDGIEVRFSEDGEILVKGDHSFRGYYKNPEETSKKKIDGWIRTGDAGTIDKDGHLVIYDRVNDLLELRNGKKYSPSMIENRLKFSPYIKDCMVIGGKLRDHLVAIIIIDFDNVGKWAEKSRIAYTTYVDLSQKREIYDLMQKEVEKVNSGLPESNLRIKKFVILHKEFDPDEGDLTRTRKLKRGHLEGKWGSLIDAIYSNAATVEVEAEVKYRDGRAGKVITELTIRRIIDEGEIS